MKWMLQVLVLSGGVLLSCTAFRERLAVRDLRITFTSATLEEVSLSGARLRLSFSAYNPNAVRAVLDRFSFDLYGNDVRIATGETSQQLAVEPRKSADLSVDVFVPWTALSSGLARAIREKSARLKVEGFAHVSTPLGDLRFRVVDVARTFR